MSVDQQRHCWSDAGRVSGAWLRDLVDETIDTLLSYALSDNGVPRR